MERDYTPLITRFQNDEFLYCTYIYGMMVNNGDYTEARDYLAVIGASGEEQQDFVVIQEINLDRLVDFTYAPNTSELNTVYTVGMKVYPMSGYARSLYRYFTGERLELELEYDEDDPEVAPRSWNSRVESAFKVWPNPVAGTINIDAPVYGDVLIQIHDIHGRPVHTQNISALEGQTMTMDVSRIPEGLYILSLHDTSDNRLKYSTRIVITK
ncbi:MAG TPA: T9SS type A sorting domain-containing protein [Saprospiraceae bacterium]|nr:T9SS type A sorting domain-containing protein [Saprospiraceae bacterium]